MKEYKYQNASFFKEDVEYEFLQPATNFKFKSKVFFERGSVWTEYGLNYKVTTIKVLS